MIFLSVLPISRERVTRISVIPAQPQARPRLSGATGQDAPRSIAVPLSILDPRLALPRTSIPLRESVRARHRYSQVPARNFHRAALATCLSRKRRARLDKAILGPVDCSSGNLEQAGHGRDNYRDRDFAVRATVLEARRGSTRPDESRAARCAHVPQNIRPARGARTAQRERSPGLATAGAKTAPKSLRAPVYRHAEFRGLRSSQRRMQTGERLRGCED